jgi:hypothetical protein
MYSTDSRICSYKSTLKTNGFSKQATIYLSSTRPCMIQNILVAEATR